MNSVDLEREVGDSIYIMKKQGQNINYELAIGIRRKQRLCSPDLNINYGEAFNVEIRERVKAECTGTRLNSERDAAHHKARFYFGEEGVTAPSNLFNLTVDLNQKPGIIISVDKANYNIKDICYVT